MGTANLFTNSTEIYANEEVLGDRFDAWRPGYNEIFSPYSSPSTKAVNGSNSGIFIRLVSIGSGPSGSAALNIYKAGVGGYTDSSILQLTPPSRPMGLFVMPCDSQPTINGYKRIKLKWNHNQEPDMRRVIESDTIKRYKIYRSMTESMSEIPPDALQYSENYYEYIATEDVPISTLPSFTDTLNSICNVPPVFGEPWIPFPVRYRVQAMDKYDDVSVLSDFAKTQAWNVATGGGQEEGRLLSSENPNVPDDYDLKQNYPNPFNPITNIGYDLPFDNFVSIKIYNVLGEEVAMLVNEIKNAGRYIVSFNASNYSSGIYYYKIQSGNFEHVRKMILLK